MRVLYFFNEFYKKQCNNSLFNQKASDISNLNKKVQKKILTFYLDNNKKKSIKKQSKWVEKQKKVHLNT